MEPKAEQDLDSVTENMSTVNPDVTERQEKEQETAPERVLDTEEAKIPKKAKTDRQGRAFDPALHEVNADGTPKMNRDGFIAGKPGRPGKFKAEHARRTGTASPADPQSAPAQPQAPDTGAVNRRNTAILSTAIFIRLGVGFFGDEWLPMKREGLDEQQDMVELFDNYYKSAGISDLPPGWALALGLVGYAAVRVTQPTTNTKMKVLFSGIKNAIGKFFSGIFKMFGKFKGVKIHAAHVNPRDHGERKDDARKETGEPVQGQGNPGLSA